MNQIIKAVFIALVFLVQPVFADFKAGGTAYLNGEYEAAAQYFEAAAEKGDHRAMVVLGSMYAGGQGVEENYKQAFTWFRKASKYGRPDANYKIGLMYEQGLGIKQNYGKALRYYGKAAKKGYPLAQYKLGAYYAEGLGVETNPVKAYAWLSVANNKLEAAINTPTENEQASAELLAKQDEFKQNTGQQKLNDLRNRVQQLEQSLSSEEKQSAQELIAKYSRY